MLADRRWAGAVKLSRRAAEARSRALGSPAAGEGEDWRAAAAELAGEIDGRVEDAEGVLEGSDLKSTVPGRWTVATMAMAVSLSAAHSQSAAEWSSRGSSRGSATAAAAKAETSAADGWIVAATRAAGAERAARGTAMAAPGSPSWEEEEECGRELERAKVDLADRWDRACAAWSAAEGRARAAGDPAAGAAAAKRADAASMVAELAGVLWKGPP